MIKLCFCILILALALGALVSIVIFAVDVIKWHDREEKVEVQPSKTPEEIIGEILVNYKEGEVNEDDRRTDEPGEYNTSAFPFSWCES